MIIERQQYASNAPSVELSAEASTLGVKPGQEPSPLLSVEFAGCYVLFKAVATMRTRNGERFWLYRSANELPGLGLVRLKIFDD